MTCDHIHRMRLALEAHDQMMAYQQRQIEQDLAIPQYGMQTQYNPNDQTDQVYKSDDLFMDSYMSEGWEYQGNTETLAYQPEQQTEEIYIINQPVVHHQPKTVVATAANQPRYVPGVGLYKPAPRIEEIVEEHETDAKEPEQDIQGIKSALARAVFSDIHALDQSDRQQLFTEPANQVETVRQQLKASIDDALGIQQSESAYMPLLYNAQ